MIIFKAQQMLNRVLSLFGLVVLTRSQMKTLGHDISTVDPETLKVWEDVRGYVELVFAVWEAKERACGEFGDARDVEEWERLLWMLNHFYRKHPFKREVVSSELSDFWAFVCQKANAEAMRSMDAERADFFESVLFPNGTRLLTGMTT